MYVALMSIRFEANKIHKVTVIGAGTMGHGIAHVAALAGISVRLFDAMAGGASAGVDKIHRNLDKGVALGKLALDAANAAKSRLRAVDSFTEACAGTHCVIEAVPELLSLKLEIFEDADRDAPGNALMATNTSSLPIASIAGALKDPSRMVGMHFFNPVHVMKLIEVVRHETCDSSAVSCAVGLAQRFDKTAITVSDSPGFASSRLGLVIGLEAMRMFEQGVASAADIDTAMKLGYGHPMGPLELTDLVGLDVRLGISDYLAKSVSAAFLAPDVLRQKVADGKLGKKSGEGFYRWGDDGKRIG
jgi:3-hydroxybutyryl-CoA dehydrogenase